jgi:hypothetical protein
MKKLGIEEGDVILLTDGRLTRVVSPLHKGTTFEDYFMLQFIDANGEHLQLDDNTLDIERNLGQSEGVLSSFYTARSIHIRLNNTKLF